MKSLNQLLLDFDYEQNFKMMIFMLERVIFMLLK